MKKKTKANRAVVTGKSDAENVQLRDYFAAMVIGGMQALKDERVWRSDSGQTVDEWRSDICAADAKFAYTQADAMLSARESKP